jgi:hypothetical protein
MRPVVQPVGDSQFQALVLAQDGFLDVAVAAGREGGLGSDDREARFLEDPERGCVVAGRPRVQRPGGDKAQEQLQGPARDAASPGRPADPVVTSVRPSRTKAAMLPTSWSSQVIARLMMPGDDLTLAMCASNAPPSSGSSGVNAAIRTDSGSRI